MSCFIRRARSGAQHFNPVAPRPRGIHQLTDNVAESHKQGTATLLYNGWLDPVSSEFWVDQLSLTLHRASTPSVGPTIRVCRDPLADAPCQGYGITPSLAPCTMLRPSAHASGAPQPLVDSAGVGPSLAFLISPPVRFCQAGIFFHRGLHPL